jgi:hypothetical protein
MFKQLNKRHINVLHFADIQYKVRGQHLNKKVEYEYVNKIIINMYKQPLIIEKANFTSAVLSIAFCLMLANCLQKQRNSLHLCLNCVIEVVLSISCSNN